ncbi:MAG: ABC transporter permease [bacterium]|nr:ABC transporter permease [bacterium]
MLALVFWRLASFIPTLIVASAILFVAVNVVPGSAALSALGIHATPQALKRFEHQHGLDRPLAVQYVEWAGKALQGDFGTSFQNAVPVGPEVRKRIPVTLQLAGMAFVVAIVLAIPLGVLAGFRHQTGADGVVTTLATLFGSTPNFWLATLLIWFFSLQLGWLPTGGYIGFAEDPAGNLERMLLPCIALGVVSSGLLIRIMRTAVIEVMSSNFIETARSKGVGDLRLVSFHVLRNALIPFFTVSAVEFGFLVGSVVIIEDVFRIPGIGSLVLVGIINRDYPVLLAAAMTVTVIVLVVNLIVDLAAQVIDPRQVRTGHGS